MKENLTPLMRQYYQIKQKYPDTILLFRMGDFFETFDDDAITTSKVCGITLTKRNNGAAGESPLAGFPHHQLDNYLPKIVRAGYRVAVCEQLEDPKKARGIVKRGVVEVVTPGVALYDKLLDSKKNNYIASICFRIEKSGYIMVGFSAADISTGEFLTAEFPLAKLNETLENFTPPEIIINKAQKETITDELRNLSFKPSITKLEDWIFDVSFGREALLRQFKTQNLKGFGIEDSSLCIASSGALIHYISETQQGKMNQLKSIGLFNADDFMPLDYATRRNLEIIHSFNDGRQEGSLFSILDVTCTPMGGRLLKKWLSFPLIKLNQINQRLRAVQYLYQNDEMRRKTIVELKKISDLERLISKISTTRANPRDAIALKNSLKIISSIKNIFATTDNDYLSEIINSLNPLLEVVSIIENALLDDPSVNIGSGNIFKEKYSAELNEYVNAKYSGKNWINAFRESERSRTQIPSLKVGFNSVFGYYIEVTKIHSKNVPDYYERKQTLTNAERYTTKELKQIESKILSAEEKIAEIESELFNNILNQISAYTQEIQRNAALIATLDCLVSFAEVSIANDYTLPIVDESLDIVIEDGRHPVVEQLLPKGQSYTPNSTFLNTSELVHIITGPNMSGKSCYLRQVALIVLMAHVGCFVPAKSARIGIVDRIFTRVGAQDNITSGESTFLVEMQEAANIMNNATNRSLILLDEVGRGTATFDGISIAWSIAEFIHNRIGARTLFATHYHELNELAHRYENIVNYKVEVIEAGSTIIFTHSLKRGTSDHSFGIHVAQMAGIPLEIIQRAESIMKSLENKSATQSNAEISADIPNISSIETQKKSQEDSQLAIFELRDDELHRKLLELKINNITPVQALQIISDWQKEIRRNIKR